jgi:hypothetical protein
MLGYQLVVAVDDVVNAVTHGETVAVGDAHAQ